MAKLLSLALFTTPDAQFENNRTALDTKANLAKDPTAHTVHCLYEVSFCNASGFAVVDSDESGDFDIVYTLDDALNTEVRNELAPLAADDASQTGFIFSVTAFDDMSGTLRSLDQVVTVSGPLVDLYCWQTRDGITLDTQVDLTLDPLNHTLHCLVEVDVCRQSGYAIVADEDEDGTWETLYILDSGLNAEALELMLADVCSASH